MKYRIEIIISLSAMLLLQACSVKKYIPEDELLYTGADLELKSDDPIENKKDLKNQLQALIGPEPNSKFLGSRFGLYVYYKGEQENPGFINRFLSKRVGQEPVYLSDVDPFQTEKLLKNRLENRGYFYSRVNHSVDENEEDKFAHIQYTAVLPENPYILENYRMDNDSLEIYREIKET